MHASRIVQLAFVLSSCSSSASLSDFAVAIHHANNSAQPFMIVPKEYVFGTGGPTGFFETAEGHQFRGQWYLETTAEGQRLSLSGNCAVDDANLQSITVPFYSERTTYAEFSCSGVFNLHFIKTDRLTQELLDQALYDQDSVFASVIVDRFQTYVDSYGTQIAFSVGEHGSFVDHREFNPARIGPARERRAFGYFAPPYYYALTSPVGKLVFLGKRSRK